jgi:hypothetical protein
MVLEKVSKKGEEKEVTKKTIYTKAERSVCFIFM